MKMRIMFISLVALSFFLFFIGYIATNSTEFRLCEHNQYSCRESLNRVGDPITDVTPALALVFLALALYPLAFSAWKKFALWATPVLIFIFATYTPGYWDPAPETVFKFFSWLYAIVSLSIIIRARWSSRK